jgi:hypothetical protein
MPAPFAPCHQPTNTGHDCRYPADRCPLHAPELPVPSARQRDPKDDLNIRALAQNAIARVFDGAASPLQTSRLVRALRSFQTVEPDPWDREEALRGVELSGRLMHGMPPRDPEQWALAREMYDDDGMREFIRWAKHYNDPYPLDLDEQLNSPTWDSKYNYVEGGWGLPDSQPADEVDTDDTPPARAATGRRP